MIASRRAPLAALAAALLLGPAGGPGRALAQPSASGAGLPDLRGTPYPQARRLLAIMAYEPASPARRPRCQASDERCSAYLEAEGCSTAGRAPCTFLWQNAAGNLVEVRTTGLDTLVVDSLRCRSGCAD